MINTSLTELTLYGLLTFFDPFIYLIHCFNVQLSGNEIGTDGAINMSEVLLSNKTLTKLDLDGEKR